MWAGRTQPTVVRRMRLFDRPMPKYGPDSAESDGTNRTSSGADGMAKLLKSQTNFEIQVEGLLPSKNGMHDGDEQAVRYLILGLNEPVTTSKPSGAATPSSSVAVPAQRNAGRPRVTESPGIGYRLRRYGPRLDSDQRPDSIGRGPRRRGRAGGASPSGGRRGAAGGGARSALGSRNDVGGGALGGSKLADRGERWMAG